MRRTYFLVLVFIFGSTALFAGEAGDNAITSETLVSEARQMMAEIYAGMKAERRLPPDIGDQEIKKRTDGNIEFLKKLKIFDATKEQDSSFKKGEFNDAKNLEQLGEQVKLLKSLDADLPIHTVYAIRHYEAKDLKGARLELCQRIVSCNVETLRSLNGGESQKRSK